MDAPASRMPLVIDDDLLERFWSKAHRYDFPDVCWPWTGADSGRGYGYFKLNGKMISSHVLSWRLSNGGAPVPEGMDVMHSCDVRSCVRPEHLSVGTRRDNVVDALEKKRGFTPWSYGAKHPHAKLNDEMVRFIRKAREDGAAGRSIPALLQEKYGVSISVKNVWKIIRRERWKHID